MLLVQKKIPSLDFFCHKINRGGASHAALLRSDAPPRLPLMESNGYSVRTERELCGKRRTNGIPVRCLINTISVGVGDVICNILYFFLDIIKIFIILGLHSI